jgi:hypothetical protein
MSGPTLPVDQVATTNRLRGNGFRAAASTAANTAAGAAPSRLGCRRAPATSTDQSRASCCIASSDVNDRPRQNESRTYGMARSTRALSRGFAALAGSMSVP